MTLSEGAFINSVSLLGEVFPYQDRLSPGDAQEKRAGSRLGEIYGSLCGHSQVQMKCWSLKRSRRASCRMGTRGRFGA